MNTIRIASTSAIALALALAGQSVLAEQQTSTSNQGRDMGQSSAQAQASQQSGKISKRAEDFDDIDVYNRKGDEIGELEELVRQGENGKIQAVISVGGFFDIGDKDIVVPLEELSMHEDKLVLSEREATEKQLKTRPAYDESQYQELADDEQVEIERSDFAAFESDRGAKMSKDEDMSGADHKDTGTDSSQR